jgi:hypothetical protein
MESKTRSIGPRGLLFLLCDICLRTTRVNAWIATLGGYLQTAQVMTPAGVMPGSDIPFARKIAVG